MIRRTNNLKPSRKIALLALGAVFALSACAPAMTQEQIDALVQERVAQTVEAQNKMGTAVAQTVEAQSSRPTPTAALPTLPPGVIPTLTPILPIPTVTPVVVSGGGGGGGGATKAKYACSAWTRKPRDGEAFKPGDPFDIVWIITNVGTATMREGTDLSWFSGYRFIDSNGIELPELKPGESFEFHSDANAPLEKGYYVMTWKVEGGLCWPYVAINSGK